MDPVGLACWEILLHSLFPPCLQCLPSARCMSGRGQETSHETAATAKTRQTLDLTRVWRREWQEDWKFPSGSISPSSSGRPAGNRQRG